MVTIEAARKIALSFEGSNEEPHFEKASFRVKKKIFATMDEEKQQIIVKLSEMDQSVFSGFDRKIIYPVPGAWGRQGWTILELKKIKKEIFETVLTASYCQVAPIKLAEKYRQK